MRLTHVAVALGTVLAAWALIAWLADLPHFILPSPGRVAIAWWENRESIGWHSLVTLGEIALGLLIGATLGILAALALAQSRLARLVVGPLLVFSQALPVFALAPILVLWFGYGLWSKVAMAVLIIFFPVLSSFLDALLRPPQGMMDLARVMNGRPLRVMWHLRIPAALPALASGLRLAAVYAPIGAVIGEWVGASEGLGYLMLLASGRAKTDLMFAALLTLGVLSVLLYLAADALARRAVRHHGPQL